MDGQTCIGTCHNSFCVFQVLAVAYNNNEPLGKDVSVLIVFVKVAFLVTLSSMERPVKHAHFNFSVLRQGFKKYSHDQKVLVSILSLARKIFSRASNPLLRVKASYINGRQ